MSDHGQPPDPEGAEGNGRDGLEEQDLRVLETWRRGGIWTRGVLSTLARRGIAFRHAHPERAEVLIRLLQRDPLYKGGQFLFDLMEWEDFMLAGPPAELVRTTLDPASLTRLADFLHKVRAHLDGALIDAPPSALEVMAHPATPEELLPPLEGGFYLYEDVVLGVVRSVGPTLEQIESR
ncbi:MAG: hypothetical protein BMS9Abin29_1306 [Gemmatimonadota bacterium]|nr:MAG: hypothetical protein BMS9Abin29_1306 [Gemmatimonadota bacterium]